MYKLTQEQKDWLLNDFEEAVTRSLIDPDLGHIAETAARMYSEAQECCKNDLPLTPLLVDHVMYFQEYVQERMLVNAVTAAFLGATKHPDYLAAKKYNENLILLCTGILNTQALHESLTTQACN